MRVDRNQCTDRHAGDAGNLAHAAQCRLDIQSAAEILCGGESLDRHLATQLLEHGNELWNLYGPTETTVWSTCEQIRSVAPRAVITIGKPIANTTIHILDANGLPVPAGAVGELCIGGAGLALGYHRLAELTRQKFSPDPGNADALLYKSGDLARCRADGRIELLGRLDRQIKLRGFRIEPAEIEAALNALPTVSAAAVGLHEDRLIAYVVPAGTMPARDSMRAALRKRLPGYMLPDLFSELEALPLTPNGKVDRRSLPPPVAADSAADAAGRIEPEGPLEKLLAGLFADVLARPGLGAEAHFFDLGGHSLLATQLLARIRDALGMQIPLRTLFDEPTVAGLARRLASPEVQRAARQATQTTDELTPRDDLYRERAPVSLMQRRLWFLDQLEPGSSTYNLAWSLQLNGPLDQAALQSALQLLVDRHEILRTTFVAADGEPQQCIAPDMTLNIDWLSLPEPAPETVAGRTVAARGTTFRARFRPVAARACHLFCASCASPAHCHSSHHCRRLVNGCAVR